MSLDKNSFKTLNKSNIIAFNEAYLNTIPAKYKHMVKDFYKTATGSWMIDLEDGYTTSYGTDYIECRFKRDCIWELINEVSADRLDEALLYHGSPNKSLTKLEIAKEKTTGDEFGSGIYLTKDYDEAKGYSGPEGRVYKVSLNNNNLYNLKELLPQSIKEIVRSELLDNKDIRNQIVSVVSQEVLEERQDTTTANQCHEDTTGSRGIFAQALSSEVEDSTPHYAGHETAEEHENHAHWQLDTLECHYPCLREEHHAQ